MERITLVCTSLGDNRGLLHKMIDGAKGFYEMLIHTNEEGGTYYKDNYVNGFWNDPFYYSITDSYNKLIGMANTEWICCMCDDDYFYPEALSKMIEEVHKGIDADVAHFKFNVIGYMPKEDVRGRIHRRLTGKSEYVLWEKYPITAKLLKRHGRMPAASFFRKSAWEKVGGFQGDKFHDWDLWKRMAEAGCKFRFFDHVVYNFVRRENSAWNRQNKNLQNLSQ